MPIVAWASVFLEMYIAFLDEFGHVGPFQFRSAPRYNESPVFGLAGILLPSESVRRFATWFYQLKGHLLEREIQASGKHPATWEKKGSDLFVARAVRKREEIRLAGFRLINKTISCGGKIFYYGREKWMHPSHSNPTGLYRTVLSQSIRRIDEFCSTRDQDFLMIMDEHSDRKALFETAAKTMFGDSPAQRLLEPPFEVESYLYQTVQVADWISSLIGKLWNYRPRPTQYSNHDVFEMYFGVRIDSAATHSTIFRCPPRQLSLNP